MEQCVGYNHNLQLICYNKGNVKKNCQKRTKNFFIYFSIPLNAINYPSQNTQNTKNHWCFQNLLVVIGF